MLAEQWVSRLLSYSEMSTILQYMAHLMIICGIIVFFSLICGFRATYGRYSEESWLTKFSLPARLAWFIQESPSFAIPVYLLYTSRVPSYSALNVITIYLFIIHYFQRTLVYPFLIKGGKPTPAHLCFLAFIFCMYNGFLQGMWHLRYAHYTYDWFSIIRACFGLGVFFSGMLLNIHSDAILRNLRSPGEKGYKIPRGGMFEYVSGANFFGESLEWAGYAFLAGSLPAAAFAVFTVCNIGPRAIHHHQWYLKKFEDYPKNRKAFIPFLL